VADDPADDAAREDPDGDDAGRDDPDGDDAGRDDPDEDGEDVDDAGRDDPDEDGEDVDDAPDGEDAAGDHEDAEDGLVVENPGEVRNSLVRSSARPSAMPRSRSAASTRLKYAGWRLSATGCPSSAT
jgi:hypothetical protein